MKFVGKGKFVFGEVHRKMKVPLTCSFQEKESWSEVMFTGKESRSNVKFTGHVKLVCHQVRFTGKGKLVEGKVSRKRKVCLKWSL